MNDSLKEEIMKRAHYDFGIAYQAMRSSVIRKSGALNYVDRQLVFKKIDEAVKEKYHK